VIALLWLLPLALALGGVFAALFVLAARDGQFDDLDDAPLRMLQDDGPKHHWGAGRPAPPTDPPARPE